MAAGKITIITLCLVLIVGVFSVNAQMREVIIENTGLFNSIRDAILADLNANGEEVVNNTKYILRRGEYYTNTEQYEPSHKVWLEAEPGEGPRPVIQPITLGEEAPRLCRATNDMTYISLRYEGLDQTGTHTDNAPYRQRGKGTTMTVIDNLVINHRHEIFRVDDTDQNWYIYDNIIGHCYRRTDWRRGYPFNFRHTKTDSMVARNNTFYMSRANLMLNNNNGGMKYFEFSQNTIYALAGFFHEGHYNDPEETALINFGTAQNVVCKDNLIQDCMVWGWKPEFADSISVINVDLTDSTENIEVSHNNIWRDPEFMALNPDTVEIVKWFDSELASLIGEDGAAYGFISEPVAFNDVPSEARLRESLTMFWENPSTAINTVFNLDSLPDISAVDFGYTATLSPTASSTGGPLGDARWHGGVTVSIKDQNAVQMVSSFKLHGNYPNPFNPGTKIRFDLPTTTKVQITVMNILGQVVYETPLKSFTAGANKEITIDGSSWASGVYFYRVSAEMLNSKMVKTGKMILIK